MLVSGDDSERRVGEKPMAASLLVAMIYYQKYLRRRNGESDSRGNVAA